MADQPMAGYRVLAAHAHPDDEALFTGGTLAQLREQGADVKVATATLGECGEVIGTRYQGLVAELGDGLGGLRLREWEDSLAELQVSGEFLGGLGRFRDSGMAGSESHRDQRALVNNLDSAIAAMAELFDVFRPHIVLTYGPDGGYGHPDHIAVHQAVHGALERSSWTPRRVWWSILERQGHFEALAAMEPPRGWMQPPADYLRNFTNEGADLDFVLGDAAMAAKRRAMAAHPTQIWLADGTTTPTNPQPAWAVCPQPELAPWAYALSNLYLMPILRSEHYQLGWGEMPENASLVGGIDRDDE